MFKQKFIAPVALLVALASPPILAQESTEPAAGDASSSVSSRQSVESKSGPYKPDRIEEVIVTATKRAENLREIPSSITAIYGADLEQKGVEGIEDIAKLVPGLNVSDNGVSGARVTIRGVAADQFTSSTTGVLFGNVSFVDVYFPIVSLDPNPFDLAAVEVLKGPQGTLFGASALNGAVRYVPQEAEIGAWSSRVFIQATSVEEGDNGWSGGGALNIPVGETAAIRLVGFHRDIPGYIDNNSPGVMQKDSNHSDQTGTRGIFHWQPDDAWDIDLLFASQKTRSNDLDTADNIRGNLSATNRPSLGRVESEYQIANLNVAYRFADWGGEIVSDTAYVEKDSDKNLCNSSTALQQDPPFCFLRIIYGARSKTFSQELRLVSPSNDSPWRYVAGIAGFKQDIVSVQRAPFGASSQEQVALLDELLPGFSALLPPEGGTISLQDLDLDVTAKEVSAFGELTRELGRFELTLGGRYYVTTSGGASVVSGPLTSLVSLSREPDLDDEIEERGFNPKASLLYRFTDDILAYATAARGFRVGGVQPGSPFLPSPSGRQVPSVFKSDEIWSYEAGVRTAWLDNTLQIDATVYMLDWSDPQLLQPDGAGIGNYIDNVGGVEGEGVEAAINYRTPFGLRLSVAAAYSKMRTTTPFEASSGNTVPEGSPWPMAPEWQTATTLSYPMFLGKWSIDPGLTHTYISRALYDLNTQYPVLDYQQWNAHLSLSNPSAQWMPDISLSISNLTDERAVTGFVGQTEDNNSAAGTYVRYVQPRTISLRLSKDF